MQPTIVTDDVVMFNPSSDLNLRLLSNGSGEKNSSMIVDDVPKLGKMFRKLLQFESDVDVVGRWRTERGHPAFRSGIQSFFN